VVGEEQEDVPQPCTHGTTILKSVPASSATVARIFSVVGNAFSKKRRRTEQEQLESLAFAKLNIESWRLKQPDT